MSRHDPPPDPPVVKGVTGRFLNAGITEAATIATEADNGDDVVLLGANIRQAVCGSRRVLHA